MESSPEGRHSGIGKNSLTWNCVSLAHISFSEDSALAALDLSLL